MRTSFEITETITEIAEVLEVDLSNAGAQFTIERDSSRLVCRRVGLNQIELVHYATPSNLPNAQMVFFVGDVFANEWLGIEFYELSTDTVLNVGEIGLSGQLESCDQLKQSEIARCIDDWFATYENLLAI